MPQKSLCVTLELGLHSVSCPGKTFRDKSDIFLEVCLFGRHIRTKPRVGIFPIAINERFLFRKIFFSCPDPQSLANSLQDERVTMELVQESSAIADGIVLATLDLPASVFLYPNPSATPVYGFAERELLLERSMHFDGISPKLEFSTNTSVKEISTTAVDELEDRLESIRFESEDVTLHRHAPGAYNGGDYSHKLTNSSGGRPCDQHSTGNEYMFCPTVLKTKVVPTLCQEKETGHIEVFSSEFSFKRKRRFLTNHRASSVKKSSMINLDRILDSAKSSMSEKTLKELLV